MEEPQRRYAPVFDMPSTPCLSIPTAPNGIEEKLTKLESQAPKAIHNITFSDQITPVSIHVDYSYSRVNGLNLIPPQADRERDRHARATKRLREVITSAASIQPQWPAEFQEAKKLPFSGSKCTTEMIQAMVTKF